MSSPTSGRAPVQEIVVDAGTQLTCVTRGDGTTLVLFKQQRVTTIYWKFIELAAIPVAGKRLKAYTSTHAVCAWCLECNKEVDYVKGF